MTDKTPIRHRYTGVVVDYEPWDGVTSWRDRFFAACPVCGLGVTSPFDRPMAHAECIKAAREAATTE
jgi:hypothetical protein